MKFRLMTSAIATAVLLAACGGGSGSDPAGSRARTLSGTAAAGLPLVGSVTIKDANGVTRTVSIGGNGAYTIDVSGLSAPFLLRASGTAGGATYVVHSAATSADVNGNINITPLTDLILSNVAGQIATNYFDSGNFGSLNAAQLSAEAAKLKEKLLPVLQAMGVDAATDLLRTAFTPLSSALDKALDAISVSYDTATNVATLTNLLTNQQIADDITMPAAQETAPPVMNDTAGLDLAADDIPLIRAALGNFSAIFKTGLPTSAAIRSHLTSDFLDLDQNGEEMAAEMAGDESNVGMQLTDVTIHRIIYPSTDNNYLEPVAIASFSVKNANGVLLEREQHFQLKKIGGAWKLHGNQRVLDIAAHVQMMRAYISIESATQECSVSGLAFRIQDTNIDNSSQVAFIVVKGPGLPDSGIIYERANGDGVWHAVNASVPVDGLYPLALACSGQEGGGISDDQIALIPDNASYTLTMYDDNETILSELGDQGSYHMSMAARPMTRPELAASTAFPTITSPSTFADFVSGTFTDPTISASNMNPLSDGWVYVRARYAGSNDRSAERDVTPSANGTFSHSLTLPAGSGSLLDKELRVETRDQGLRRLMSYYLHNQSPPPAVVSSVIPVPPAPAP